VLIQKKLLGKFCMGFLGCRGVTTYLHVKLHRLEQWFHRPEW